MQHFEALSGTLEALESAKRGIPVKRTLNNYGRSTPVKPKPSRMAASPQTPIGPEYAARLRSVNERIMSEIGRIDQELEQLGDTDEELSSGLLEDETEYDEAEGENDVLPFNTETQNFLENLEFPSSPVISPLEDTGSPFQSAYTPESTLVVTTTLLSVEEKGRVREWAEAVGAIFVSQYSTAVTHVIAKTTAESPKIAIRSMKTMQAIVDGRWLLPVSWIDACATSAAVLREELFELEGDQYSDDEGPRRSRMSHRNNESKLFDGYRFYLFGTFGTPTRQDLETLLVAAGAQVIPTVEELARCKGSDSDVVVLGDPNELYNLEKDQGIIERFTFLQTEWIYSSISAFELLECQHFRFL